MEEQDTNYLGDRESCDSEVPIFVTTLT